MSLWLQLLSSSGSSGRIRGARNMKSMRTPLAAIFLPPANEVWGKVLFLHLSVSHSVHSGHRSGQYASCWNAYLFMTYVHRAGGGGKGADPLLFRKNTIEFSPVSEFQFIKKSSSNWQGNRFSHHKLQSPSISVRIFLSFPSFAFFPK